jgi:hypothetical protein
MFGGRAPFTSPWNGARARLRPAKGPKTFIRPAPNQRLETKPDCISVGLCPGRRLCVPQEVVVDVEGLLHTYDYAITIWLIWPYPGPQAANPALHRGHVPRQRHSRRASIEARSRREPEGCLTCPARSEEGPVIRTTVMNTERAERFERGREADCDGSNTDCH